MALPKVDTPEWQELIGVYPSSTKEQREQWASDFDYPYIGAFMARMRERNITLSKAQDTPLIKKEYTIPPTATLEEHIRVMQAMDNVVAPHVKTPDEVHLYFDTTLPIAITNSADDHLGQFGCDYDSWLKDHKAVAAEPGVYINKGGDLINNIIQASKVGSGHNQSPIAVQKAVASLMFKMLADKIGVVESGNHVDWDALLTGEDWLGEKLRKLKLVYIKDGATVYYHVGEQTYIHYIRHKGRFNSSFNLTHICKQYQRLYCPQARIVSFEHHHVASIEQYNYDGKECIAFRPGTYGVYDDYARQNGFLGAHVCNPTVVLYPDKDKLVGFKDMYDAFIYLQAVRKDNV